jgi:drug/metabolite transporter (DMT)-like permease
MTVVTGGVEPHRHSLRGVALFLLSLLIFASMDTTVKFLAKSLPVPVIMAGRYIVNTALMLAVLAPLQGRRLYQTNRTRWVVARGLCLALASFLMGLALQRMPVAEATAIVFLAPFVVVLFSGPALGEKVSATSWLGAGLGFVGVLCIARPGSGLDTWGVIFALANVLASACYQLMSRQLSASERPVPMLFFSAAIGAVAFGAWLPWMSQDALPTGWEWGLLFLVGLCSGLGHYLYTSAFAQAPASVLAPLSYAQMVWAGLLGWVVFSHVPDAWTLIGMGIIASAGLLSTLGRRR